MATLIYDNNELTTRDFRAMATTMGQYMTKLTNMGYHVVYTNADYSYVKMSKYKTA